MVYKGCETKGDDSRGGNGDVVSVGDIGIVGRVGVDVVGRRSLHVIQRNNIGPFV